MKTVVQQCIFGGVYTRVFHLKSAKNLHANCELAKL